MKDSQRNGQKFEDAKEIIKRHKSMKDRQHNGQKFLAIVLFVLHQRFRNYAAFHFFLTLSVHREGHSGNETSVYIYVVFLFLFFCLIKFGSCFFNFKHRICKHCRLTKYSCETGSKS
jgi:hypothetical protein